MEFQKFRANRWGMLFSKNAFYRLNREFYNFLSNNDQIKVNVVCHCLILGFCANWNKAEFDYYMIKPISKILYMHLISIAIFLNELIGFVNKQY